jgi:hypothetical protein
MMPRDWNPVPRYGTIDWSEFNLEALPTKFIQDRFDGSVVLSNLLGWISKTAMPKDLRKEVGEIAPRLGVSKLQASLLQLDYELGGGCCTTAAIPDEEYGSYRMVRACDWEIPTGFAKRIKWTEIFPGVWQRTVPAYIGCICGHSIDRRFALALNQSECVYQNIDFNGAPLPWALRAVLMATDFDNAVARAMSIRPIIGGYVTIVGEEEAVWLEIDPAGNREVQRVRYPDQLVVCNEDGGPKYGEDEELSDWAERGTFKTEDIGHPVRNGATADLVQFVV